MSLCAICASNIKKGLVKCKSCEFESCAKCIEKYIVSSGLKPQCMSCHEAWNRLFLADHLPNVAVTRIYKSETERLFQYERSLFPETQEYVHYYIELKKVILPGIKKLRCSFWSKYGPNYAVTGDFNRTTNKDYLKLRDYEDKESRYTDIVHGNRDTPYNSDEHSLLENTANNGNVEGPSSVGGRIIPSIADVNNKYVKKCEDETCNGFIRKSDYKCGLCHLKICKECYVEMKPNMTHVCKEEDVLNTIQLKDNTKSCPVCCVLIHKIEGCDHMFCTSCKTPFIWSTMVIQRNGNTNPHYIEWMNSMTENGSTEDHTQTYDTLRSSAVYKTLSKISQDIMEELMTNMVSFMWIVRNGPINVMSQDQMNRHNRFIRIRFMRKEITERYFKSSFIKVYTSNEISPHLIDMAQKLSLSLDQLMTHCRKETVTTHEAYEIFKEFMEAKHEFNSFKRKLFKVYKFEMDEL